MKKKIIIIGLVCLMGSNLFGKENISSACQTSFDKTKGSVLYGLKKMNLGDNYGFKIAQELILDSCYDTIYTQCNDKELKYLSSISTEEQDNDSLIKLCKDTLAIKMKK